VEGYHLENYPGKVHPDGVRALVDCLMQSPEPVTLIAIGPAPNIRAALELEPRIAPRTRFVGMFGSIRKDVFDHDGAIAEWNVKCDIPAARAIFAAPWLSRVITPLDTCGRVQLRDDKYARVRDCPDPLVRAVIENYRLWAARDGSDPDAQSSLLYDTVAIYLAFSETLLGMEEIGIQVTDEGFTRPNPAALKWRCATTWRDLPAFEDLLVTRLTGSGGEPPPHAR
jgi:inosine-uridine nucleoside N-ribohydrolase